MKVTYCLECKKKVPANGGVTNGYSIFCSVPCMVAHAKTLGNAEMAGRDFFM